MAAMAKHPTKKKKRPGSQHFISPLACQILGLEIDFHSVRVVVRRGRGLAVLSIEGAIPGRRSAHAGRASGAIGGTGQSRRAKLSNGRTKSWPTSPLQ